MEWYEVAFDSLYPVIYEHRNIEEAEAVVDKFVPLFDRSEPVLDLACGNGRYLECFARRGFEVFGLDLSHYLLRMCLDSWGHSGAIVQGDMRRLPLADQSVGTVINMFTSFGYFSKDTDNLLVSKEVFRILKPGGKFLFDFINAHKITADLLEESERESGRYKIYEQRKLDGFGKYLIKNVEVTHLQSGKTDQIEEHLRLYSKDELVIMFKSVGFEIESIFGGYQQDPFVEGVSDRVLIVSTRT
jgi:SAM-dependent methyltransferase